MNPEIIFFQNQVEHYEKQIEFCKKMGMDLRQDQMAWEEKLIFCEGEKYKAERMIGLIDIKNIFKKAV